MHECSKNTLIFAELNVPVGSHWTWASIALTHALSESDLTQSMSEIVRNTQANIAYLYLKDGIVLKTRVYMKTVPSGSEETSPKSDQPNRQQI